MKNKSQQALTLDGIATDNKDNIASFLKDRDFCTARLICKSWAGALQGKIKERQEKQIPFSDSLYPGSFIYKCFSKDKRVILTILETACLEKITKYMRANKPDQNWLQLQQILELTCNDITLFHDELVKRHADQGWMIGLHVNLGAVQEVSEVYKLQQDHNLLLSDFLTPELMLNKENKPIVKLNDERMTVWMSMDETPFPASCVVIGIRGIDQNTLSSLLDRLEEKNYIDERLAIRALKLNAVKLGITYVPPKVDPDLVELKKDLMSFCEKIKGEKLSILMNAMTAFTSKIFQIPSHGIFKVVDEIERIAKNKKLDLAAKLGALEKCLAQVSYYKDFKSGLDHIIKIYSEKLQEKQPKTSI